MYMVGVSSNIEENYVVLILQCKFMHIGQLSWDPITANSLLKIYKKFSESLLKHSQ